MSGCPSFIIRSSKSYQWYISRISRSNLSLFLSTHCHSQIISLEFVASDS